MEIAPFLATLPTEQRLALIYAPVRSRSLALGLFALDSKFAAVIRRAHEPLLGQVQLAWWRDQLALAPDRRARGEPLLALLEQWQGETASLAALVDAWEEFLGGGTLGQAELARHAEARAQACAALARLLGNSADETEALRAGRNWAIADLAARLGAAPEREAARELAARQDWRPARLSRALRPLAVLHGLARRRRGTAPLLDGPLSLAIALRLGLFGA